ncbi:histone deacetylase family protein [Dictyocaulus viviparus]|uniref:Histone deacetylase family protein n=1 Tax=Dictyocaulus viviparus TaxID=29172 RepID=A0A0D8Y2J3_DICVI|nr:histone deacetylase family protein [Dictyocaulus viviparus]
MSFNQFSESSTKCGTSIDRQAPGDDAKQIKSIGLFVDISDQQCPLIFHEIYDVKFLGLEKCHPFDAGKWGKVYAKLKNWQLVSDETIVRPIEATRCDLLIAHSKWYQCGGTVAACRIALDRGWAVHIGGGFHHAYRSSGGGFCVYADISLALKLLFSTNLIEKAMIIDLDAHQGNGHERDFGNDDRVFILDVYNPRIYPHDHKAEEGISRSVHVGSMTSDAEYLSLVKRHFTAALLKFKCDLVVYNAGTDSLENDPLGCLSLSKECIIQRDELVFRICDQNKTPIAMLTSGGYLLESASVIAASIRNLHNKDLIQLKA